MVEPAYGTFTNKELNLISIPVNECIHRLQKGISRICVIARHVSPGFKFQRVLMAFDGFNRQPCGHDIIA